MSSNEILSQNTVQDPQNFEIDIDGIYNDFIKEIDNIRSIVSTQFGNNQAFQKKTAGILNAQNKIEISPQESRCHAFFRLIGFPVIGADHNFYNPGFDITGYDMKKNGLQQQMTRDAKLTIANNPIDKFQSLSQQRENYINRFLSVFSQNLSIDASTLALSSSTNIRSFAAHFQDADPFDMLPISQTYVANLSGQIGKLTQVSLLDYVDQVGNKPQEKNLQINRYHFIKPFIVDPRIDFNVPNSKKIAVPFTFNKSNLLIGDNTYIKRPLIEKVIRDRLLVENQSDTLGTADQYIRDYILNVPEVKNQELIQQMISNNIYKMSEQQQFNKYLRIIGSMIMKLVDAQNKIQKAQSKYYWLPIPSTKSPEGGVDVRDIIISTSLPTNYITEHDESIIKDILLQTTNRFNIQTSENNTSDIGNFAFDFFANTFTNETSQSLGSIVDQNLQEITNERTMILKEAGEALQEIEIIIGEFSGFGLCDIIAIIGSLYIISIEDLVGFLDSDAYLRMIGILGLSNPPDQSSIDFSMQNLANRVRDYYNIMDSLYLSVKKNNQIL